MRTLERALMETPAAGEVVDWCRPNKGSLQHIAERTGADIEALRAMTFEALSPQVRGDELTDRFRFGRLRRSGRPALRRERLAVCPTCLRDDPYLHSSWMLGWASVCAKHAVVLVTRCPRCNSSLRLPASENRSPPPMERCAHCGTHISAAQQIPARTEVIHLQEMLMVGKRCGRVEFPGLGGMDWLTATAVLDVLLTVVQIGPTEAQQRDLYARIGRDFRLPIGEVHPWYSRYGSSLIFAWFLTDWPRNLNRAGRILHSEPLSPVFAQCAQSDEAVRDSLRALFRPRSHSDRLAARRWIAHLPYTPEDLRDQAMQARFRHRQQRLLAFATLREGRSMRDAAAAGGVTEFTLNQWLRAGARGGLDAALDRKRGGHLVVTDEQAEQIAHWFAQMPTHRRRSLNALTAASVVGSLRERFGTEIPERLAGRLLAAHRKRRVWVGQRSKDGDVSTQLRNIVRGYGT